MLIFAVDDEESVLEETKAVLSRTVTGVEVMTFKRGAAALEAVRQGMKPDAVFCDIEMPGLSGLEFAVRLKELSPETRIIFVTGYEKYAVQAFRIKVHGYLMKPLTVDEVREELSYLPKPYPEAAPEKLNIRCFGFFDVFWQGESVMFPRKKTKELLAYLVDRKGAACTAEEIAVALWEESVDRKAELQRVRTILSDLKSALKAIGMEDVLIREHRQIALRTELLDCDYYRMLAGDMDALNTYHGEYMKQYSWAELTNAHLYFDKEKP